MRTRTAPTGPEEAPEASPAGGTGLTFDESLTWRAGQKIPTADLLRRLGVLAQELKEHEQEEIDPEVLTQPAKELVHPNLIDHKDAGIRALVASCLVDILRLCAPSAPFSASQLKAIFKLFISRIVPALSDPTNPYNSHHLYVVSSLSTVKSIVLLTDLPSSNELTLNLFVTCFDILSNPDDELSKNLEYSMTGILCSLIDETPNLPPEVLDIILAQFLRADPSAGVANLARNKKSGQVPVNDPSQSTLGPKQLSSAYNMAKNICVTCVERMSRLINQYFCTVIVDASGQHLNRKGRERNRGKMNDREEMTDDEEEEREPDAEDVQELGKAHRLLQELWKAAPTVLSSVIPQIEAELSAENVQLRLLATVTIGNMISGIGAAGPPAAPIHNPSAYPPQTLESASRSNQPNFLTPSASLSFLLTYPTTYHTFLGRYHDKSSIIRAAWVKAMGRILSTSAGGIGLSLQDMRDLATSFSALLTDNDEKVRLVAIESITTFELQDVVTKLGILGGVDRPGSVFSNLTDRVKDKKVPVRTAAALLLGQLWGVAYGEIAASNEQVLDLFRSVPSRILDAIYVNDVGIDNLVDQVIFESLWPINFPTTKKKDKKPGDQAATQAETTTAQEDADMLRTERLLILVRDLEKKAKVAFLSRMARPRKLADYVRAFLKRCEDFNGGVIDKADTEIRNHLDRLIDFWSKQLPDPTRAAEDLMRFAKMNDRRNYSLIQFCIAEASDYKKIHRSIKELQKRLDGLSTTTGTLPQTMTAFLYRISNLYYNRSHIRPIMSFCRSDEKSLGSAAHELLKEISQQSPGSLKGYGEELCHILQEQAPTLGRSTDNSALDDLKACSTYAKSFPGDIPNDRNFLQAMVQYAQFGSPAATGKYASSILIAATDKKDMYAKDLVTNCVKDFKFGSPGFRTRLATLSQVMLSGYEYLDETQDVDPVIDIGINQILLQNRTAVAEAEPIWEEPMDEETEAKVWTLKILVNRLRAQENAKAVKEIASSVYQLLTKLVLCNGELSDDDKTPKAQKSRLRLQAALLLLKLSAHKDFDSFLTAKAFNILATVAQDSAQQVRDRFVTKIKKYLGQDRLPSRFYSIIFLLAFEPSKSLREDTITWVRARSLALTKLKKKTLEGAFARFLSVLVHHPDFDTSEDELENLIKYLVFYLKAVATEDNLSLILHVAQQVKGKADAIDTTKSDALYYTSDLAVAVITQYEDLHNWSMQAYAGQIRLPKDLFQELPDDEARQAVAHKQYLPTEFQEQVEGFVKAVVRNTKKRKSDVEAQHPAKKRATATEETASTEPKAKALPIRKPKKAPASKRKKPKSTSPEAAREAPSSERRRSGRSGGRKSYAEDPDSNDDADMEEDVNDSEEKVNGKGPNKGAEVKKKSVVDIPGSEDELSEPPESDEE